MVRARVEASSPAAQNALEALLELTASYGAEINPGLYLREQGGHISVHANAADGELLIRLPEELLVPMDGALWHTSGGDLVIVHHDESSSVAQRRLAEALVAAYNATEKVEWARAALPRIALSQMPTVLDVIRSLRPGFAAQPVTVAQEFVRTRVLSWSLGGDVEQAARGRFLMPVIDLINHHEHGARWAGADAALRIPIARAAGDSQCFVRYRARQDPLDLALGYGFVDDSCTLVRSLAVTVEIQGLGRVDVAGHVVAARSTLDPPSVSIEADHLKLSHVVFDTRHPERLTGVLQLAVTAFLARHGQAAIPRNAQQLTDRLVVGLIDQNLVELENAHRALADSGGVPASHTITLAIEAKQRLLRAFRQTIAEE